MCRLLFEENMSLEILAEQQQQLRQTTPLFNAELINKYSKYVKTIGKRVVEGLFLKECRWMTKCTRLLLCFSGILLVSS